MPGDAHGVTSWLEIRIEGRRLARYAEDDSEAARLGAWMAARRAGCEAVIMRVFAEGGEEPVTRVPPD